jgi:hypothetical protein
LESKPHFSGQEKREDHGEGRAKPNAVQVEVCYSQFHQKFASNFFAPTFFRQNITKTTVIIVKLLKTLLNKKAAHKMMLKLTPGSPIPSQLITGLKSPLLIFQHSFVFQFID